MSSATPVGKTIDRAYRLICLLFFGLNDIAYLATNEAEQIFVILNFATARDKRLFATMLMNALKARGVPEEQIILTKPGDAMLL